MTSEPPRVVFDCNVLFQALISTHGPAFRCTRLAEEGRVQLFTSEYVFDEIRSVAKRPFLQKKFLLDSTKAEVFLADVDSYAVRLSVVPESYRHPTDPMDSHDVNLALTAGERLIVSRDSHFLDLNDPNRPNGVDFLRQYPGLRVLDPICFLREIDLTTSQQGPPA